MRLGLYRYCSTKVRKPRKLTAMDFDIALFISERDQSTKYDIMKYVTKSSATVTTCLNYLVDKRIIKITQQHRVQAGMSRKYAIAVKGRHMITDFYTLMNSPVY